LNGETAQTLQSTIPTARGGMAGGLSATVRFAAILLAVAVLGVVLAHEATLDFAHRVGSVDAAPIMRRVIAGDSGGLAVTVREIARVSLAAGIGWLMVAAATVAGTSGALVWRLLPAGALARRASLEPLAAE
jgi:hypothetical protein